MACFYEHLDGYASLIETAAHPALRLTLFVIMLSKQTSDDLIGILLLSPSLVVTIALVSLLTDYALMVSFARNQDTLDSGGLFR